MISFAYGVILNKGIFGRILYEVDKSKIPLIITVHSIAFL
jgi:hypothetical protein